MARLSFGDFLDVRLFGSQQAVGLSPDGRWAAYALQRQGDLGEPRGPAVANTAAGSRLWLTDVDSGETLQPCPAEWTSWAPAWNADGSALAFFAAQRADAPVHVCVWEPRTRRRRLLDGTAVRGGFGIDGPRWTADGSHICVTAVPEGPEGEAPAAAAGNAEAVPAVKVRVFETPRPVGAPRRRFGGPSGDVALLDAATGAVRRLTTGLPVDYAYPAPVGTAILWTEILQRPDPNRFAFRCPVHLVGPGLADRVVAEYGGQMATLPPPRWAPDGRAFALLSEGAVEVHRVGVEGGCGPPVVLSLPDGHTPGDEFLLWSADGTRLLVTEGNTLWWLGAGGEAPRALPLHPVHGVLHDATAGILPAGDLLLVGPGTGGGGATIWRQPADGGAPSPVFDAGDRHLPAPPFCHFLGSPAATTRDGHRLIHLVGPRGRPPDLWLQEPATGGCRRITAVNPTLEAADLGEWVRFPFRTLDGSEAWCACLLPPDRGAGRGAPAVVTFYPGSNRSHDVGFEAGSVVPHAWLAQEGFAILAVDVPYDPKAPSDPIDAGAAAVLPAVTEAVRLGYVDADRLALLGHSYGGYGVLSLVTRTRRFRAAVASAGIADMASWYGTMHGALTGSAPRIQISNAEEGQGGMGAPPWERPLRYVRNSPVFHLDRVTTPLFLVCGAEDNTIPWLQSGEVFAGLRRLGRSCTLLVYDGEGHVPARWREAQRRDLAERLLQWLQRHLA